tara:strand:+ start:2617 stop:2931 length:315 start_codon:yes stop_codon:yes gene_type:complete
MALLVAETAAAGQAGLVATAARAAATAGWVMDDEVETAARVEAVMEKAVEARERPRAASREAARVPKAADEAEGHSHCNRFRAHTSCTLRQRHHHRTNHRQPMR